MKGISSVTMRNLTLARANLLLADRQMGKSDRIEAVSAPLHNAMLFVEQTLVAAQEDREKRQETHHRPSARGVRARKLGLRTLRELSQDMGVDLAKLAKAPKAEWHHDLWSGKRVWYYDPGKVWAWVKGQRRAGNL